MSPTIQPVSACSLILPKTGFEYASEIVATDFNGNIIDRRYLEDFNLGADCSVDPPFLRTDAGKLILSDPYNEIQEINLIQDKLA